MRRRADDPFAPFEPYLRQRFEGDPHVWAQVLLRELRPLDFTASYQTPGDQSPRLASALLGKCSGVKGRPTTEIDHDPGDETQWDYLELPETPWGSPARVLVGVLAHSGRRGTRTAKA